MQTRLLFSATALMLILAACRDATVSGDDLTADRLEAASIPHTDTEFPVLPVIERLNSGQISPEEAATQIMALQEEHSPPVHMPPDSFFASLPEDERQKVREVFRLLVSWTQNPPAYPGSMDPADLPKRGDR